MMSCDDVSDQEYRRYRRNDLLLQAAIVILGTLGLAAVAVPAYLAIIAGRLNDAKAIGHKAGGERLECTVLTE